MRLRWLILSAAIGTAWLGGCTQQIALPTVVTADGPVERRDAARDRAVVVDASPDLLTEPDQAVAPPVDALAPVVDGSADAACLPGRWINNLMLHNPQVVIALDRSASMFQRYDGAMMTRLEIVQQALRRSMRDYRQAIHFGYIEFPAPDCEHDMCCTSSLWIRPADDRVDVIEQKWRCDDPAVCSKDNPESPVSSALMRCRESFLRNVNPSASRHVFILTDGEPSCSTVTAKSDCETSIEEVVDLKNANVQTSVYGLAQNIAASACLQSMAIAGGADPMRVPSHYVALTETALRDQLDEQLRSIAKEACSFGFNTVAAGQPMRVWIDESIQVNQDPSHVEGWDFDTAANMSFTIYGKWCDRLRNEDHDVDIEVCGTPP
jgi:hypothetical protein